MDEVVPDLTPVPVAESDLIARATEIVGTGFDVTTQVPFRARLFAVTETGPRPSTCWCWSCTTSRPTVSRWVR
ncbi:hypothetical protein [Rhodococcus pyridinivorans]|uniref:hypothetical protein n=1 Tax=Rhodococcus pyridinivorans TaxID=103816 RepID=UPI001E6274B5